MSSEKEQVPVVDYSIPIRRKIGEKQEGTIKIGAEIIEVLSEGIYTSPENALKELVSNSYDSDATHSNLKFDLRDNVLTVEDDGLGMDYEDFDRNFTFITGSEKRHGRPTTIKYGRPVIGRIGIGFVSASQLCEKMIVRSAKEGADTWFEAEIDWGKMRQQIKEAAKAKKEFYEISRYTITNHNKTDLKQHYTVIELHQLTKEISEILTNKQLRHERHWRFKNRTIAQIVDWITNHITNIDKQLTPYWTFVVKLASIVPVPYLENGPIRQINAPAVHNHIDEMKRDVEKLNFRVTFDGLELKKPILLPCKNYETSFDVFWFDKELTAEDNTTLHVRGYFYNQQGHIAVENWRGMVIRIKNTAIGEPDNSFMDYTYPGEKLYMPWTYGEVYALDGLEDAMNINRSSFKLNHPHYRALREFIHDYLHKIVLESSRTRYYQRAEKKQRKIQSVHDSARDELIKTSFGQAFRSLAVDGQSEEPTRVDEKKHLVQVFTRSKPFVNRKKEHRILLADVLIAFEAALKTSNGDLSKLRKHFIDYLNELPR